jgi:hypothetical protein
MTLFAVLMSYLFSQQQRRAEEVVLAEEVFPPDDRPWTIRQADRLAEIARYYDRGVAIREATNRGRVVSVDDRNRTVTYIPWVIVQ